MALAVTGCDGCRGDDDRAASGAIAPKPPAPAPADLVAKLRLSRPKETLRALRAAAGGPAIFLPRSLGTMVVNAVGFPITAAEVVDEQLPLVAAMSGSGESRHMAAAVHVLDREKLVTIVGGGKAAFFGFEREGERIWFTPNPSARKPEIEGSLALIDNYLVLGTDRDAVKHLGPYLARTLGPAARRDGPDLVVDLDGPLVVPSPGDSLPELSLPPELEAAVDLPALVQEWTRRLRSTKGGRIAMSVTDARIELTGRLEPSSSLPTRVVVPRSGLLEVPDDVVIALTWADEAEAREASAARRAGQLRALLEIETSDEAEVPALDEAMMKVARGMGDRHILGLRCTGVGLTGFARGAVKDAEILKSGLAWLAELRGHPAVTAHLERKELELGFEGRRLAHVPFDILRFRLTPREASTAGDRGEVDLLYGVGDQVYAAAAGMQTVETMQRLIKRDEERELSQQAPLAMAVQRLPKEVWAGIVLDAQNLHGCLLGQPGGLPLPVAAAVGPEGGAVAFRVEAARPLVKIIFDVATR